MRSLRPDPRTGMLVANRPTVYTGSPIHNYIQPTRALSNLDKIVHGGAIPSILISRRHGGIGDVIMTTPTIRAISKKFNCKIDYATDYDYLGGALPKCLEGNPYINRIFSWRDIDLEEYNATVDLTCPCVAHEVPGANPINRIDLFARHVGIKLEDHYLDFFITQDELKWAKEYILEHRLDRFKLVMVQPSASATRRDIPLDKLKRVVNQAVTKTKNVAFLPIIHTDSDTVKTDWNYLNIHKLENFNIRKLAALMHYCDLVLCPDSSILHLAAALKKKTVTIFGPTDPRARVNYHPEAVAIWPGKELRGYPCVVGDSMVLTATGYKEIQNIQLDDLVKTKSSQYLPVREIHVNPLDSRALLDLNIYGNNQPITITEDHKMLVSRQYMSSKKYSGKKYIPNPEWIEAKDIKPRDFICIPRNREPLILSLDNYSIGWLYGIFYAEGYFKITKQKKTHQVRFCLGSHETDLAKRIQDLLKEHFQKNSQIEGPYKGSKGSIIVNCNGQDIFNHFKETFKYPLNAGIKEVPIKILSSSTETIRGFLSGVMDGDGYKNKKRENEQVITTKSKLGAYGIQELYTRLGLLAKVYYRERSTNMKKNVYIYRVCVNHSEKHRRYIIDENFIYTPLKTVIKSKKEDKLVYDITVAEDTTFTISNFATWDCWYENPLDGYMCWKILEEETIINTIIALLNNLPLPSSRHFITFGNYSQNSAMFEKV